MKFKMGKLFRRVLKMTALLLFFFLAGTCGIFAPTAEGETMQISPKYVEGEFLVVIRAPEESAFFRMGVFDENAFSQALLRDAEAVAQRHRLRASRTFTGIARVSERNILHLTSDSQQSTEELIQTLLSDPSVESVQRNYIVRASQTRPNDPLYKNLWGMENIGMPKAWHYHATGSRDVVVAVFDSGINHDHPDLQANMARDSFGNHGRSFRGRISNGNTRDDDGHGTHVAGIIGAVGNNGVGVAGVNWEVGLLAVKVLHGSPPTGTVNNVIDGINYVLSEKRNGLNIRVANMSLGGWMSPQANNSPQAVAIQSLSDAGIITVMAAGNESQNLNNPTGRYEGQRHYPSSFRLNNTISVGAINPQNARSTYSNYGNQWVDIAAPGDNILSTHLGDGYKQLSGSSMAAPHVAGAAALLIAYSNEPAPIIRARILHAARNYGVADGLWADGTLDVIAALSIPDISVPWIIEQPQSQVAEPGGAVSFSVTATDTTYWFYQWQRSNNNGASWKNIGTDQSTYSLIAQAYDNSAQFRVIVSNEFCRIISEAVTLTVPSGGSGGGCNAGHGVIALVFVGAVAFIARKKK